MYEAGNAVACRDPKHAENLLARRARRVRDAEPHAKRAVGEPAFHQGIEPGQVGVGERTMGPAAARVARDHGNARERRVVRNECPARAHMAGADAVINEGATGALGVPRRDRVGPDLELERGGHAVVRVIAVALGILPVGVEIDEPGRDDETGDVEGLTRRERLRGKCRNPAAPDAHVALGVQGCLGVEHAPAHEDEIELLALRPCRVSREHGRAEEDH